MSCARLLLLCATLSAVLAACSGGQQSQITPAMDPAAVNAANAPAAVDMGAQASGLPQTQLATQATTTSTTATIQTSGTIEGLTSTGFTLQTGGIHGFVPVTTSSSTVYAGAKPFGGESVSVSGTGTYSSLRALSVTQAGAPSSTTTTPTTGIPKHIATWAYDEYWAQGARGTTAQVREYLSFAQSGLGNGKAASDCAGGYCKSVFYFDPHFFYDTTVCGLSGDAKSIASEANESWFVHETGYADFGHRAQGRYTQSCGGRSVTSPVYALNDLSTGVRNFYNSYLHANAAAFDDFFIDDTSGQVLTQFYGPGGGFCQNAARHYCLSTQEMRTDAGVVEEHGALANSLTHTNGTAMQGVYNGLNFTSGRPNDLDVLKSSTHFIGAVCEGCVVSGGALRPSMYASVLNAMAEINAIPNGNIILMSNGATAGGSTQQIIARNLTTGMIWLGYSYGHTIVWPNLEQGSQNLSIFPEDSIYPSSPIQTMSSGATDVQVTTGVYRREFRSCYNAGVYIGPCASIVNSTGTSRVVSSTWLHQTYSHVVQLIGGDIPSGGRISLTSIPFYPNSTYVGPGQGLLIVR